METTDRIALEYILRQFYNSINKYFFFEKTYLHKLKRYF